MAGVLLLAVIVLTLASVIRGLPGETLPDFREIPDVTERKEAFYQYLWPHVMAVNRKIFRERARLDGLGHLMDMGWRSRRDDRWLREISQAYGVQYPERMQLGIEELENLFQRIDTIPPSMVMAQAAIESGWGSSRFAREGNNLFGMRCYKPGCGLVPRKRPRGATYEVKRYHTVRESIFDYVMNLNSNPAYVDLRRIRSQARKQGRAPEGLTVADGLYRYSSEGWTYVDKVQQFIRQHDLGIYDEEN